MLELYLPLEVDMAEDSLRWTSMQVWWAPTGITLGAGGNETWHVWEFGRKLRRAQAF
jgi:hypothetical protein